MLSLHACAFELNFHFAGIAAVLVKPQLTTRCQKKLRLLTHDVRLQDLTDVPLSNSLLLSIHHLSFLWRSFIVFHAAKMH